MKQKAFHLFLAALSFAAALSCQKTSVSATTDLPSEEGTGLMRVRFVHTLPTTKAVDGEMQEHLINSVQLFIFSPQGVLENDKYEQLDEPTSNSVVCSVRTRTGNKKVYAILNAPKLTKVGTLASLEATLSDLKENKESNLVMSGKVDDVEVKDYTPFTGEPKEFVIYVKKLAAAIQLNKVKVDFLDTDLQGSTFKLKEIYLKNVVGRAPYGVASEGDGTKTAGIPLPLSNEDRTNHAYWYNKLTLENQPLYVTRDKCNLNTQFISTGDMGIGATTVTVGRTLYAYPNATVDDPESGGTTTVFSPRHTRLVLHGLISTGSNTTMSFTDKDFYYTFDLPQLEANKKYRIDINITMLGKENDNDDSKTSSGQAKPTITVVEWDDIVDIEYNM